MAESQKIKVLHFIHGLTFGGAETVVKEISLGLDKSKFDLTVLCSIKYGTEYEKLLEDNNIHVEYINDYSKKKPSKKITKILIAIRRFVRIRRYIHELRPDVIHIHLCLNAYIRFALPRKPVKIFYHVHAEPYFVWRNDVRDKKAAKWLVRHYGMRFITLHERMKHEIDEMFHVNNTVVLNNGIDFDRFINLPSSENEKKSLGIPENAFVIGHIGRFEEEKNHKYLIEVFKEIHKSNPNAFLLMIGEGTLKKTIQESLLNEKLENNYKILSNRKDVPEILQAMNFFVFPSLCEGLGIVLIEAQKAGIKCVASNTVPEQTRVSNYIKYLDINDSPIKWANEILNYNSQKEEFYGIEAWDIKNVIKQLEHYYLEN